MNRRPSRLLLFSALSIACQHNADAGGGQTDPATASSPSSSSDDPSDDDPSDNGPPTSAADTPTSTSTISTDSSMASSTGEPDTGSPPDTASGGTTGEIPSPSCGDAILDPGEECDLGAAKNNDQGACTLMCKTAKCGDNLIWAGEESCDNGPDNNDNLYAGCTTQCQFGPRCNDGELQGPEECDLGPANGTSEAPPNSVPCSNTCRFAAKLVFLSSVAYMGGELKGAEGAHHRCQELATQAMFDNATHFKAWISDALHSPAKDFTHTVGMPFVRPDGVRIADDWDDLIINGPDDGITVTDTGETLLTKGVWTGTAPNGELHPDTLTCKSWMSSKAADMGIRGLSGIDQQQEPEWMQWVEKRQWTHYAGYNCYAAYPIYCFEQ
jgi:hypothetical protein